jgi:glycosyltransferase involved in cell wall biosynthesis
MERAERSARGATPEAVVPTELNADPIVGSNRSRSDEASFRRIEAQGADEDRIDLLVHALSQLADNVTLELSDRLADRQRIEALAKAYGIDERVRFCTPPPDASSVALPSTMAELIHELADPRDPPADCRERDEIFTGHRIAIVTNLPAPYRLPLLSKINRRLNDAGADFRALFMGLQSQGRPWIHPGADAEFAYESLRSFELPLGVRRPLFPLNLERRLSVFRPTVVLTAGFSPAVSSRAARYAKRQGAVFGIWSGEIPGRHHSTNRLRHLQRKHLARRADFAVAYGYLAGEYLRSLRRDLPLVYGRNTSGAFALQHERPPRPQTVELLAVADMAKPGKGIEVLVDALKSRPRLPCTLTVVGPGAGASGLEDRAGSDERIRFLGALPQDRVRECYAGSDVFLFPSSAEADVFGLALVEAMGSGLAPVMATGPGAVADLAIDGWNCLVVQDRTSRAWASALERVVLDHDLRSTLQTNAAKTITDRWTMEHACDAMIAGLRLGLLVAGKKAA